MSTPTHWKVKKGNTSIQDIPIYQRDGTTLETNLATAARIEFNVCKSKKGAAIISKTVGSGITVNTPNTGYVRVKLLPSDTSIEPGDYWMGLEVNWGADDNYECRLKVNDVETELFEIEQDVVNT